jgi:Cu+-exporting ATPase
MTITPVAAVASREADGTTHHFCSAHCAASFDADPQRYTTVQANK